MPRIVRAITWRDFLFTVKTFAAAMLALYIAFRLDLSQPSWSLTTVYIVSQPYAGMVLAKSLYRVLGTVIGAAMSVVFVALLSDSRELFCLALALWIGAGTFVAIYLRDAPQAYMGMLAGYSAAIIGLPAVLAPDTAFDLAVARCLEITLGIACGTLIHHLVLPQRAGDVLRRALAAALPDMARWTTDALAGPRSEAAELDDRRRIVTTVMSLDALRVFAVLDTPAIRAVETAIRQFEGKLLSLLALLVSIHDRVALLKRHDPARAAALDPLLRRVAEHIEGSADAASPAPREDDTGETALAARLAADLPPVPTLRREPAAFLTRTILLRLADMLTMWRDAVRLRSHIAAGEPPSDADPAPAFHPYRDAGFALIGGAISVVTVLIASGFWIATAWPNGPTAVTFAGIICAILGGRDDPVAGATTFFRMTAAGAILAGAYLFVVLPPLDAFPELVLALAPFYLLCGLFLAAPASAPVVMPIIFAAGGLLGVTNQMVYDVPAFLNNAAAYLVGIGIGGAALGLLRPLGGDWAVQRLVRGMMADLARAARSGTLERRSAFESRTFDRINALFARLDPMDAAQRAIMQGGLAGLRVGGNILALGTLQPQLPPPAAAEVGRARDALAAHFARAAAQRRGTTPLPVLTAVRERVLSLAEDVVLTSAAEALYSIEMTLAQHAAFFGVDAPDSPAVFPEAVPA